MKKLTLDQAWKGCMKQWDEAIAKLDAGDKRDVEDIKEDCLPQNITLYNYCFFCQYVYQQGVTACRYCPGRLIAARFRCSNKTYHYRNKPRKFYAKLQKMYKKYQESIKGEKK